MLTPLNARAIANIVCTGAYFGLLQWSAFFLLQSFLTSTALVWLVSSFMWLAGSIVGLLWRAERISEPWWIALGAAAYYALWWLASTHLYDLAILPALYVCLAAMGLYAGRFFRLRPSAEPSAAKWLFFLENTGFVAGLLITVLSLFWFGEKPLVIAPLIGAALCVITLPAATPAR